MNPPAALKLKSSMDANLAIMEEVQAIIDATYIKLRQELKRKVLKFTLLQSCMSEFKMPQRNTMDLRLTLRKINEIWKL